MENKFNMYDIRVPDYLVRQNKDGHSDPVTAITFNPANSNYCMTGSFDDHLRMWDVRNLKEEIMEENRGGSTYRIVWRPDKKP